MERRHAEARRAARAPQAQLPVLHMTERRKGRMPDAPGHAPAMGGARNEIRMRVYCTPPSSVIAANIGGR